jgi:hypothetical protein
MGIRATAKPIKKAATASTDRLAIAVTLKGSAEWKAWVDDLADHCRTDVSKLIDMALVEFAKGHGFSRQAPRR